MRFGQAISGISLLTTAWALSAVQVPLLQHVISNATISLKLFNELEELARIVDIAYCVGVTGIWKPFRCVSRCNEFDNFELVTTWNTGPLLADSCGYIALDHSPSSPRIIVAFRGTYSIASTIADLSTIPQQYVPYPDDSDSGKLLERSDFRNTLQQCSNCTVHLGFLASWQVTRPTVMAALKSTIAEHANYSLTVVGHSLGGAVALLAALEFKTLGWKPRVTTFGEPRVGNAAFVEHVDFHLVNDCEHESDGSCVRDAMHAGEKETTPSENYHRVTHIDDPVPLLPLIEWGYQPHAGEIYISKAQLAPLPTDVHVCQGDQDRDCIAGGANSTTEAGHDFNEWEGDRTPSSKYRLWQLFFAHRDYFWRLGLCVPGGAMVNNEGQ